MRLTETALATRSGTTEQRIRRLVDLGILEPDDGGFRPPDILRVRVTEALDQAGIPPEHLSRVIAEGAFTFGPADVLFPDPIPLSTRTLEDVASDLGIPIPLAQRALTVFSVAPPAAGEPIRDDDAGILEVVAQVHETLGRDEDRTITGIRYFGENLRRIAESQMRWFQTRVQDAYRATGISQPEMAPMVSEIASRLLPLARDAISIGYRRHLDHYTVEIIVENVELAIEGAGLGPAGHAGHPAIAFVDLTGYTALTEDEGDIVAAHIAERLTEAVRERAAARQGRTVKLMGDGAMLHFVDPAQAVRCGLELIGDIPALGLPNAHVGISSGPVVFSDGDYFGRTVNLAARIADRAEPREVLVAEGALSPIPPDLKLEPLRPFTLKGVAKPVGLYRAGWA
ncbi:MAG: adenylate/guanylate cyclase domain-containing protein [Acidimicrobiia bacterium]